jgi:CRISPR-associated protein (Cas_Cas02710)
MRVATYEEKFERLVAIRAGRVAAVAAGTAAEQAQEYLLTEMLVDLEDFTRKNSDHLPERVDLLISLVGFSPVTTILTFAALRPRQVLAITSAEAEDSIDVIHRHLVGGGGLKPSRFAHRRCTPTNPQSIYQVIKSELESLRRPGGAAPYAVIDITGGRKVMSAAAALAAWQLNLELCYLDSEFDRVHQVNRPETNRLLMLRNPIAIFGEQEMRRALELFRVGAYDAAVRRYREIADSVQEPAPARFMCALSVLYRSWCDLDLDQLPADIAGLRMQLAAVTDVLTQEVTARIEEQLDFLTRLAGGDEPAMALCYYLLGLHYKDTGRRDFAALLLYRTVEKCCTLRLQQLAPGFSGEHPDYSRLAPDVRGLEQRYTALAAEVWPNRSAAGLPLKVGLMDAALLLQVHGDDLLALAGRSTVEKLRELAGLAEARNRSVLAHGERPVTVEAVASLGRVSRKVLEAYWQLSKQQQPLHRLCERLAFVRPGL